MSCVRESAPAFWSAAALCRFPGSDQSSRLGGKLLSQKESPSISRPLVIITRGRIVIPGRTFAIVIDFGVGDMAIDEADDVSGIVESGVLLGERAFQIM